MEQGIKAIEYKIICQWFDKVMYFFTAPTSQEFIEQLENNELNCIQSFLQSDCVDYINCTCFL